VATAQIDREQNTNGSGNGGMQQGRRGGDKGDRRAKMQKMKEIAKELNLSKEQMAQVKELNRDTKQQMQAIKADETLTKELKNEKFMALKKAREEKLKTILTPEQYAQLKEKMKGKVNAGGGGRFGKKNDKAGMGDDDMFADLDDL
jgi:Spy/CpxP family protein refolding chaperone